MVRALDSSPDFVLANGLWGSQVSAAMGVSILFPSPASSVTPQELLADYDRLQFSKDLPGWRNMIAAYLETLKE